MLTEEMIESLKEYYQQSKLLKAIYYVSPNEKRYETAQLVWWDK